MRNEKTKYVSRLYAQSSIEKFKEFRISLSANLFLMTSAPLKYTNIMYLYYIFYVSNNRVFARSNLRPFLSSLISISLLILDDHDIEHECETLMTHHDGFQ